MNVRGTFLLTGCFIMTSPKLDRETLRRVFSDAHVVDVDLSAWDKYFSIWMLADHYENWTGRCPLVVVDFYEVRLLKYEMPVIVQAGSRDWHLQWRIDDFCLREDEDTIHIELSGPVSSPALQIECRHIEVRPASAEMLDELSPGWNEPHAGLARPSIENLYRSRRGRNAR